MLAPRDLEASRGSVGGASGIDEADLSKCQRADPGAGTNAYQPGRARSLAFRNTAIGPTPRSNQMGAHDPTVAWREFIDSLTQVT